MKQHIIILTLLLIALEGRSQRIARFSMYSSEVRDSFLIQIRLPKNYNKNYQYHHLYLTDGSLKIGNYILGKDSSWRANVPENCLIITIAHYGNYRVKRQRDFLISDSTDTQADAWGKADQFYFFLKNRLIPHINHTYGIKKSSAFIGHSFGGLFCVYTLFKFDKLFDRHFAISPSLWANHGKIMTVEETYSVAHDSLPAELNLMAGGLELFNMVLSGTRLFYRQINQRKYKQLHVNFYTVTNANHYSIIKPGVDNALQFYWQE